MINRIIDVCAKNKFLVFLFIGVGVLVGWHSMKNTKLDAIPDLSDTQVIVYSKWDRSPVNIGAFLKDDVDVGVAEVREASDVLYLGQAQ